MENEKGNAEVKLFYCVVCGRMYDEDNELVRSDLLRYLMYRSSEGDLDIEIVKGTCGICQN